ncbi:MAG TPA: hypothetical protein DDW87_13105 [Firmicutes bacterium]|nr:hypothetical protein [Bacillota bacterium]
MLHYIVIFIPLLGAALDILDVLFTPVGRLVVLTAVVVGLIAIFRRPGFSLGPQLAKSALISLVGAALTFVLSTQLNLGAVVASALVGLVGAQVLKGRDQLVLYLGAFVGMSSVLRFPTYGPLIVAGLLGGFLFELVDDCWIGVGGRLGTIAATAVVVVLAITGGGL